MKRTEVSTAFSGHQSLEASNGRYGRTGVHEHTLQVTASFRNLPLQRESTERLLGVDCSCSQVGKTDAQCITL